MPDVFLSYASEDRDCARTVVDASSWRQLHDGLTGATARVTLPNLAAFQF